MRNFRDYVEKPEVSTQKTKKWVYLILVSTKGSFIEWTFIFRQTVEKCSHIQIVSCREHRSWNKLGKYKKYKEKVI